MSSLETLLTEYKSILQGVEQQQHMRFNQYAIVHHSNAIENSTLTMDETTLVLEHQQTPTGKPLHDVLMAKDHYEALLYVLSLAEDKTALSQQHIQTIGSKIMKNVGGVVEGLNGSFDTRLGEYRTVIVRAGESIFPDPKKVPSLMSELILNINESIALPQTIEEQYHLSFDVHFQAVSIHPFGDGNGRFSRLLMNYVQAYHNLPLIYLFAEDKQAYFEALKLARFKASLQVFRDFMTEATTKCLQHQMNEYQNTPNQLNEKDPSKGRFISILF